MCKYFCSLCKQDSNCAQTSNYDGPQEQPPLVEGGGRERNKEAVSARANACRLRCPHHLHFGEAASRPCWRPWHHSRCNATSQERALRVWPVRREQATWHRQQAVLHQLMGHVLADRSCQEASDRLRFVLSLHIVYSFITLGLFTALFSIQTNRFHHLTRFFFCASCVWQAISII